MGQWGSVMVLLCSAGGWHQVDDNVHGEQWALTWSEHSTIGGKQWLAEF